MRLPHLLSLSSAALLALACLGMGTFHAPALGASQAATPSAQTGAPPAAPARLIGTVSAIAADSLTVKLEIGGEAIVAISPQTRIVRAAPGEKTLSGATPIRLEDLANGDRVLLRALPGADPSHYTAMIVVTMKQADIAQVHATQAEEWRKQGVSGIVKSVDPGQATPGGTAGSGTNPTATIVITSSGRTISIHTTSATTIRRYAPDSVNFADAKPAALSEIQPGDQLRARGEHSPDGTEVQAAEIVAGSFRNVAGTITAIDAAKSTLTVTDLATKKPVTLHLTSETQMRKLPPEMAQHLAARAAQGGSGDHQAGGRPEGIPGGRPDSPIAGAPGPDTAPRGPGAPDAPGQMHRGGDPAAMLQHAPAVTLAELRKGDAVMIVASRGGGGSEEAATAITLIAGVEALLENTSGTASQNLFSASWNLSGNGGAEGAAATQ